MKQKAKKYNTNNGRAKGQAQISITIPSDLVKQIDRLAELEHRNRSNFIENVLRGMLK